MDADSQRDTKSTKVSKMSAVLMGKPFICGGILLQDCDRNEERGKKKVLLLQLILSSHTWGTTLPAVSYSFIVHLAHLGFFISFL